MLVSCDIYRPAAIEQLKTLANQVGVNVETIRFYEREGLIKQPLKPATGYRHYCDDILNRVLFIKRTQELGFSLKEVDNLLRLNDSPCHQVQALAENKLKSVQDKINDLKKLQFALTELVGQCRSNTDDNSCPIIDSLLPNN
ncbi:Hg(II)-responsive transcriptional regulator [Candidatus Aerophobetes bacterium]|uniref:Mercuric resistance operon regulatory protein n=1 Tax=Aerophobetes bacterium TaxID=2030807 RepID=A0A2A4Y9W7_UNCAE|nr:MAG: Hg(II)-responsive transcriptional regulator [Candidatus Aerophobetes bacterium]